MPRTLLLLISSDKHTGPGTAALLHGVLLRELGYRVLFACRPGGTLAEAAEGVDLEILPGLFLPLNGEPWGLLPDILRLRNAARREGVEAVLTYRSGEHVSAAIALGGRLPVLRFLHAFRQYRKRSRWVRGAAFSLLRHKRTAHLFTPDPTDLGELIGLRCPDFAALPPANDQWDALARMADHGAEWLPGGVDMLRYTPDRGGNAIRRELGLRDEQVVIGMVGRMKWGRGHEPFLQAFAPAARKEPRLRALLVGDGEEKEKLAQVAAELEIADRVAIFHPGARFDEALGAIDVGFLAHPGSAGTARAALELMAMARPMVMSDTGVLQEIKRRWLRVLAETAPGVTWQAHDATTVLAEQQAHWTEQFLRLARAPDLRLSLGEAAQVTMKRHFSRNVLQRQLGARLRPLLPQAAPGPDSAPGSAHGGAPTAGGPADAGASSP